MATIPPRYDFGEHYPALAQSLAVLWHAQQWEATAHVVAVLGGYWEDHEHLEEGAQWTETLLTTPPADALPAALQARLHLLLGNFRRHQSDYPAATLHYEQALPVVATFSDPAASAAVHSGFGEIAFRQGDYARATAYYAQNFSVGQQANAVTLIADALNALGRIASVTQSVQVALDYHKEGHALAEQAGYRAGVAWSQNALGEVARIQGDFSAAREHFQNSRTLFEQEGNPAGAMLAVQNLAFALLRTGASRDAERLLHAAIRFKQRGPARHAIALCLVGLAQVELLRGNLPHAIQKTALAEQVLTQIGVVLELGDHLEFAETKARLQEMVGEATYYRLAATAPLHPLAPLLLSADVPHTTPPPAPTLLTPREVELLALVAHGLSDKQIAASLTISPHTVNAHLRSLYRKLGANNRTAAVAAARALEYLI